MVALLLNVQQLFKSLLVLDSLREIIFVTKNEQRDVGELGLGHQLVQLFLGLRKLGLIGSVHHEAAQIRIIKC